MNPVLLKVRMCINDERDAEQHYVELNEMTNNEKFKKKFKQMAKDEARQARFLETVNKI